MPTINKSVVILYETLLPGIAPYGFDGVIIRGLNKGPLVEPPLVP